MNEWKTEIDNFTHFILNLQNQQWNANLSLKIENKYTHAHTHNHKFTHNRHRQKNRKTDTNIVGCVYVHVTKLLF